MKMRKFHSLQFHKTRPCKFSILTLSCLFIMIFLDVVKAAEAFYKGFVTNSSNIMAEYSLHSEHGFVSEKNA